MINKPVTAESEPIPLLEAFNLVHCYREKGLIGAKRREVRAVDGVSLQLFPRETLGLVGESGCGKSTLANIILRLIEPVSGVVKFRGEDITAWRGEKLRLWRRRIQVVFQYTHSSLNPRMKVGGAVAEPLINFGLLKGPALENRVIELLSQVGLEPSHRERYPHQFSGGQRQRIAIARALALNPDIIVCDEATASLDVSIQAQILNLLKDLQHRFSLCYLYISHDLATVEYMSHRVAVMYLGKLVEVIDSNYLRKQSLHPYTRSLLAAVPLPNPRHRLNQGNIVKGDPPDPADPPSGCRFHPRCHQALAVCSIKEPELRSIKSQGALNHRVACHLY